MAFGTSVKFPLKEAPHWLSHIEISRDGDEISIEIIKTNGISYGIATATDVEFNTAVDLVLTRSAMEGKV